MEGKGIVMGSHIHSLYIPLGNGDVEGSHHQQIMYT
jgi:hypothetical protein